MGSDDDGDVGTEGLGGCALLPALASVSPTGLAGPGSAARDFKGLRMMRRAPMLDEAWRYWTSLREGEALPRRAALDPKRMELILGHSMILDQVRHGTVRVRLGGQALERIAGIDVRGLPIRAFFDLADRTRALDLFEQVFDTPATLELDLISDGRPGGLVTGRMLVLPMLDAAGRVTKALAVLVTDRTVEGPPRRFSVTNATMVPLAPVPRVTEPNRRAEDAPRPRTDWIRTAPEARASELAEPPATFAGRPSAVPWLRVVK